jgi:hypothetical protein
MLQFIFHLGQILNNTLPLCSFLLVCRGDIANASVEVIDRSGLLGPASIIFFPESFA